MLHYSSTDPDSLKALYSEWSEMVGGGQWFRVKGLGLGYFLDDLPSFLVMGGNDLAQPQFRQGRTERERGRDTPTQGNPHAWRCFGLWFRV